VIVLILALGYALISFAYGCSPAGSSMGKHKPHVCGVLAKKAPRGGVRWRTKRPS
jgi:hypothetical protein